MVIHQSKCPVKKLLLPTLHFHNCETLKVFKVSIGTWSTKAAILSHPFFQCLQCWRWQWPCRGAFQNTLLNCQVFTKDFQFPSFHFQFLWNSRLPGCLTFCFSKWGRRATGFHLKRTNPANMHLRQVLYHGASSACSTECKRLSANNLVSHFSIGKYSFTPMSTLLY